MKFFEAGENLIVLPARLAEAQAGIEDELRPVHPGGEGAADGGSKAVSERTPNVPSEGFALHRLGSAARVHQDQRRAVPARDFREARFKTQATDVIQNIRAGVESLLSNLCLGRINGDGDATQLPPQAADDRQHASKLFLGRDRLRSRPRGLAAHVDPVRSLAGQFHPMLDGTNRVKVLAAIGERIRSDVEHAHDEGASTHRDLAATHFDLEFRTKVHSQPGGNPWPVVR